MTNHQTSDFFVNHSKKYKSSWWRVGAFLITATNTLIWLAFMFSTLHFLKHTFNSCNVALFNSVQRHTTIHQTWIDMFSPSNIFLNIDLRTDAHFMESKSSAISRIILSNLSYLSCNGIGHGSQSSFWLLRAPHVEFWIWYKKSYPSIPWNNTESLRFIFMSFWMPLVVWSLQVILSSESFLSSFAQRWWFLRMTLVNFGGKR